MTIGTDLSLWAITWQLANPEECTFLVELQLKRPFMTRGSDHSKWEVLTWPHHPNSYTIFSFKLHYLSIFLHEIFVFQVVAALPYLDRELSPPLYRSFFIPYRWQQLNVFGLYKLLRRTEKWKKMNTQDHFDRDWGKLIVSDHILLIFT